MKKLPLRTHIRHLMAHLASAVEILISFVVLVAICIAGYHTVNDLWGIALAEAPSEAFSKFLTDAFTLIIGVEFIKMVAKHSPGSVLEVLLFAIARQMVVQHSTPLDNLLSIVAILLIFVIRRYLFVPSFGMHLPDSDKISPDLVDMLGIKSKTERRKIYNAWRESVLEEDELDEDDYSDPVTH